MVGTIATIFIVFTRRCADIIVRPYESYRSMAERPNLREIGAVGVFVLLYFLTASAVRNSLFHPYLMTRQLVVLMGAAAVVYGTAVGLFHFGSKLLGGKGTLQGLAIGWAYTLIPTSVWFWMTSILYVVLPPPRTQSVAGVSFSIVYLLVSTTLLYWKITLAYLALRFGLRLDLLRILVLSAGVLPILGALSIGLYRLGIFRIPFI